MYGRVVGIVLVVVVAGCSGTVPTGSTKDAETLTAAPVPEGTESGTDVPGVPELDDAALVAAFLENASVEERTEGSVRLVGAALAPAAVPDYLSDPRRMNVRATVRGDGHVPHVSAQYVASLDGENVSVVQDV